MPRLTHGSTTARRSVPGPWVIKDWQSGNFIEFAPNPTFREAGKPYLDKLIIKFLPSREVGMQLLGTGEITTLWDITEADFPTLDSLKEKGVAYAGAQSGENELLVLNFADPAVDAPADPAANPHPILSDLKVREAIQYAIDKQTIVDTLLYGNVNVGNTVLPAGTFACPQPPSEFSLEKADALLDEAGWTMGADNIRTKDGQKLELKITTTSGNLLREQTQQVLVEMLKQAGISLVIENVPSDVLFAGWDSDGLRKHGKFDIVLYTTGPASTRTVICLPTITPRASRPRKTPDRFQLLALHQCRVDKAIADGAATDGCGRAQRAVLPGRRTDQQGSAAHLPV